ncbi:50S ribosomal protein L13 chloroplastic [Tripterygium wilfordii]|uniref:Large ribosomal subunit protein uL13c n=1 Tax=Tripterygium wilfordii TaxID=458696 RepID=A0A7J7C288_TRIWF|nr:50S ribosomal protein L13, chloroplastic [Tripterygium wilfordii]KAF5728242.1 50S ribosomal protein L13 chloroplastic [Tripterygium wilfordii]
MAIVLSVSSSSLMLSSSSPSTSCSLPPNPFLSSLKKSTPFFGIALASSRPSVRPAFSFSTASNRNFQAVRSKAEAVVHIPLDQRWMFEESEVNGPDIWNTTWYPKAADHINTEKPWYIVDATDKILGRLASTIAIHIRGKNLATFTPSVDMGAFVIVVNADKVAVSGKKRTQKLYRRHSGRPGGMKVETFQQLQQRIPERIIEHAVRGMLPKGRLGRQLFNHLKVYKGPEHPHEAQKPIELPIRDKRIQKQT